MSTNLFEYNGKFYPEYIRQGNAVQFIKSAADVYCTGRGVDIGGTPEWHLDCAEIVNPEYNEYSAMNLPGKDYDYIFSSHCLEHVSDYITALEYWKSCLKHGGRLFLYLPHPDMEYWQPQNCRKHYHLFTPEHMERVLNTLGFTDVVVTGRDLYWSFVATGVKV